MLNSPRHSAEYMALDEGGPVSDFIKASHDSAIHVEIVLDIQPRRVYVFPFR